MSGKGIEDPLLTLRNITGGYAGVPVVYDLTMDFGGRVTGLIGSNGAGKSTTLLLVTGLLRTHRGEIRYRGEDLTRCSPREVVRRGIVYVREGRGVFPSMTVEENLLIGAYLRAARQQRKVSLDMVLSLFPRLQERLQQKAGSLSGGEQQMLAIGRGLMSCPQLLMLDEPSLGLAPSIVQLLAASISDIANQGVSVLLCEQNASLTFELTDFIYVMEQGRVVLSGTPDELASDAKVRNAYLGGVH